MQADVLDHRGAVGLRGAFDDVAQEAPRLHEVRAVARGPEEAHSRLHASDDVEPGLVPDVRGERAGDVRARERSPQDPRESERLLEAELARDPLRLVEGGAGFGVAAGGRERADEVYEQLRDAVAVADRAADL